ncbi:MAG: hypothetical protein IKJ39_00195 [Lachnospiraceae bacterium]|nr:hypothetical protein [Lachnospiraceae bacterium]
MKQATRMIKDILKLKYPDNDFHLKYYKTKDEIELFDKLTILCEKGIDVEEVISHIKKYVSGIVVYKTGELVPPIDRGVNKMISIASYNWVEMAALEYIEVKTEL